MCVVVCAPSWEGGRDARGVPVDLNLQHEHPPQARRWYDGLLQLIHIHPPRPTAQRSFSTTAPLDFQDGTPARDHCEGTAGWREGRDILLLRVTNHRQPPRRRLHAPNAGKQSTLNANTLKELHRAVAAGSGVWSLHDITLPHRCPGHPLTGFGFAHRRGVALRSCLPARHSSGRRPQDVVHQPAGCRCVHLAAAATLYLWRHTPETKPC